MLVLPVYDLLLLPGVTFYFKKDILDRMQVEKVEKGEEILFLIQKSEKRREDLTVDDFQNKGLVGTVENIDDDGNLSIRIHDRVEISDVELQNGEFMADAAICSECTDLPEEEEKAIYKKIAAQNYNYWNIDSRYILRYDLYIMDESAKFKLPMASAEIE